MNQEAEEENQFKCDELWDRKKEDELEGAVGLPGSVSPSMNPDKGEEITLQRDSCVQCLKLKAEGRKTVNGQQIYCSQGHAFELSNIKKAQGVENLKKDIFDTIYQWGRAGIIADENSPAIKVKLEDLENTWY
jgi:hypothetical protein